MKKMLLVAMVAVAGFAFGAVDDTLISISTKGPDTYGDGTIVKDGECYALVFTKFGSTFGGFAADGKLLKESDELILVASLAKDGRCPTTLFEVPKARIDKLGAGTFALYLLDTRVKDASGVVMAGGVGVCGVELPKKIGVNAAGLVAKKSGKSDSITAGAVDLAEVGVYAKISEPKITAMKVEGATVTLTVAGLAETADYFVVPGATPSKFKEAKDATRKGDDLIFEAAEGENFFKVLGVRKFK